MIEVDRLTKRYGRHVALDAITFRAEVGEIVGFLGPNGAGKTTTMRILTGFMPPTEGTARVAGHDVIEDSMAVRQCVGYLPETVSLYRDMTVQGYLTFMARLRNVPHPRARVAEVLTIVGMEERTNSLIRKLSKGMRQRVGLAQAIVHNPAVLILDEPTIGLDPHQVQDLRHLVRELGRTRTVMLSTHILAEAEQICDRVIIIDRGQIVAENTPDQLRERLFRGTRLYVRVRATGHDHDLVSLLSRVSGVASVEPAGDGYIISATGDADIRADIAAAIVQTGHALLELRPWATTLEEVFLELTNRLDESVRTVGARPHA